jgi:drug/metabolite transporter (DMT)-like permease
MLKNTSLVMVFCTFLYSLHTCLIRFFKQSIEPGLSSDLIISYQYIISFVILLPFFHKFVKRSNFQGKIPFYIIRSIIIISAAISWIYALSKVKAVNCIAISSLTPLLLVIFAPLSLGEKLTPELIFISLFGLLGAIIIIGPNPQDFNGASLFALFTAFLWAFNSLFTKKYLSPGSSSFEVFFTTVLILSMVALPYLLIKAPPLSLTGLAFLIVITIIFDLANILLIWVFSQGPISLVANLDLLRVIFTNLLSIILLGESSSATGFLGIIIILLANYLALNYKKRKEGFGLPGRI